MTEAKPDPGAAVRGFRRVVTGRDGEGRSVCLSDARIAEGPGWLYDLWQSRVPANVSEPDPPLSFPVSLTPPPGGVTFRIMKVPPRDVMENLTREDVQRTLRELGAPEAAVAAEHLTMHRTDTLDFLLVLSGRVTLHLEDGDVNLAPLDCIIQRATAHAWSTPDDEPALVAVFLVDGGG